MKKYRNLIVALAAWSLLGWGLVRAETATQSDAAAGGAAATTAAQPANKKHSSRLDTLAEKLTLNDDQKQKVGAILKDEQAALKQLKKDISVPNDLKKTRQREIVDAHEAQIRALLTPEQQATYDRLTEKTHRREKM